MHQLNKFIVHLKGHCTQIKATNDIIPEYKQSVHGNEALSALSAVKGGLMHDQLSAVTMISI